MTTPAEFPSDSHLEQNSLRWEIRATLNSLPATGERYTLASRDESGQTDGGHLSVWVDDAGVIVVRNQNVANDPWPGDTSSSRTFVLTSRPVTAGEEFTVTISLSGIGIGIFVNGELLAQDSHHASQSLNMLPVVVGGGCTTCNGGDNPGDRTPQDPTDGSVSLTIYNSPADFEPIAGPPAPVSGSIEVMHPTAETFVSIAGTVVTVAWLNPTENEDGSLYDDPRLTRLDWSGNEEEVDMRAYACNVAGVCSAPSNVEMVTL